VDLADLHFVRPLWLLAVLPVALLAIAWARRRAADSHWESSIEPALLNVLLEPGRKDPGRRLPWMVAGALTLAAVGLAGPSWERLPQPVEQRNDALVVVLDLSLSMLAEDVAPSRVVRARQKVADILRLRAEGMTGLVAYAGSAHTVVPLTDDTRTIENLLPALSPDMMPVLGSNLGSALDLARALFENSSVRQGRILVITDGVDQMGDATERRSVRFPISFLGVGTSGGGMIPINFGQQRGQVLRTQAGDPVIARLDEQQLQTIAGITHGRYRTLSLGDDDIEHVLGTRLPGEEDTLEVEREFDLWADMGFWVCVLLIPIVLAGFRRGVLVLLPFALLPVAVTLALAPAPAAAGVWDDLWQRKDQQAFTALREGEPEVAAALFGRPDWRAAALYRSGEYGAAAEAFGADPTVTGRYNLGNALARQGELEQAIAAYTEVLDVEPDHEDAAFNKALLERMLEAQQSAEQNNDERQQSRDGQPDQSSQPQGGGDGDPSNDDEPSEQSPDQPPQQPENREGESSRSQQDRSGQQEQDELASRDEQQDALDQWLRRVPDDPGGLLRRKFEYETKQRLRRGEYGSRETEKIW
jgi:Ca-activated chloride channel homolog